MSNKNKNVILSKITIFLLRFDTNIKNKKIVNLTNKHKYQNTFIVIIYY